MNVKRDPHALYCDDASLTQQNFTEESDINSIIKRASQGFAVSGRSEPPAYGDFSDIPDYQEAFDVVKRAESAFMSLSWDVRERFANDPQRMVQFLQDPKNRDEAIKFGLVAAPPPPVKDESLDALKSIDASLKAEGRAKAKPVRDD